ncbi:hypothetical protein FRACYDRAFT_246333 [Fragilariopsis cylindrus CCMP1102]|uniref:Fungal lipase-type domain-containing protein n=1 Tax=Fragilariopsis cylindrus CCMP1102 TaxID=635003 RepID=A0A1E7EYX4_9STRA|nr:hypothetical protein FRACYDRAFT_246333 [Fragilariopsis cylindrus CCMP1102]|eukprot:OEU11220.1 hypothetical protein FRACYDRAFT_246333 [Fragilariopsis cylindrus CCMP1102]
MATATLESVASKTLESAAVFAKSFPNSEIEKFLDSAHGGGKGETTHGNPPLFIGITTGSILILCWRGTHTPGDALKDFELDSTAPFEGQTLEVQKDLYNTIKNNYEINFGSIKEYVKGDYSQVKGKQAKDGVQIKRIILTGHSLGASIANVAHLCLKLPSHDWNDLVQTCKDETVCVQTIAFSAPMSIIIDNESNDLRTLIQKEIYPNMINILYSGDVVPRAYSILEYLQEFVDDINNGNKEFSSNEILDEAAKKLVDFADKVVLVDHAEQAKRYSHVGKILIISSHNATTSIYDLYDDIHDSKKSFRSIKYSEYNIPANKTVATGLKNHSFKSNGPRVSVES